MADKNTTPNTTDLNLIGKGTIIEGNITTESSIRVDGGIKGKLICKNTVTVGQTGRIQGDVEAMNAIISGKVKGKIIVSEKLVLEGKASLIGELKAKKLIIDEGSIFEGTSDMGASQSTGPSKQTAAAAENN